MKPIANITPSFLGYDDYPKDDEGKILLDRADDERIVIKRKNTLFFGSGLIGLCDGAKISNKDWKDLRRGFYLEEDDGTRHYHYSIGGSDAGAVMGVSEYSNAFTVYNAKKSMEEAEISFALDYRFEYGHINEPLIAKAFAEKVKDVGLVVYKNDCVFFNESTGFMQANVDYFVNDAKRKLNYILEIKTTSPGSTTEQNAKNGQVPATYYAQAVLHYPMVLGSAFKIAGTFFAVGSDNSPSNIHFCHFYRNPKLEAELFQKEKEFVDRLINNDPPKDTSTPRKRLEKAGFNRCESKPIAVDFDDNGKRAAERYLALSKEKARINKELKAISEQMDEEQAIMCMQLGEAEASCPFLSEGKEYVAKWSGYSKKSADLKILQLRYPEVYDEVLINNYFRKFTLSEKKEKKEKKEAKSK